MRSSPPLLAAAGFSEFFVGAFAEVAARLPGCVPGRVLSDARELYQVRTESGDLSAEPSGRLRFGSTLPVTGDWVALRPFAGEGFGVVEAVLPRRTTLSRRAAGERTEEQVLAANVDVAFAAVALGEDGNLRRLERLLALARGGGASPVALLTKADLLDDAAAGAARDAAEPVAGGTPVVLCSARSGAGLDEVRRLLGPGTTAALLGASGAGKSTLVNALVGAELLATREVRTDDGRGRHTTSARRLVQLPWGALLLDTPGLREIGLWDGDEDEGFPEVTEAAGRCRYRDCRHEEEPGCAVAAAVADGTVPAERLEAWRKLRREDAWLARRVETTPARAEKERWKGVALLRRRGKPPASPS